MSKTNAERLVESLAHHNYIVGGPTFQIMRWHGQGMMNKAAGEAAPTWQLLVNPLRHAFGKWIISNGHTPRVRFPDGEVHTVEVCSYLPLTWLLQQPIDDWEINHEFTYGDEILSINAPGLPKHWQ